jgi:membrane dipeptidase
MFIVDAHLDLAYNVTRGRDVTRPAAEQPIVENEIATVGLPDLRTGNVGLVCATIFAAPATPTSAGYTNAEEARTAALVQLDWYKQQQDAGRMKFVHDPRSLPAPGAPWTTQTTQHAILLLEGADPIRTPEDLTDWFAAGLRIIGLAWRRTRYAGGTGAPGPLTGEGVALVRELDRLGIMHDTSHLAEQSFWQLLDLSGGPVIASHSNCRAIVPTDRQLSDEMIRAIVRRGGVIGINFYDKFLLPPGEYKTRRATLADVVRHVRHACDLAGSSEHVAIGTDLDGGLGREQIPEEIKTAADLPRVAEALAAGGFSDEAVRGIMGGNWLGFFRKNLAGG